MSTSREKIFGAIRRGLGRGPLSGVARDEAEARLKAHHRHVVPMRGQIPLPERVTLFESFIREYGGTVARLKAEHEVPGAIADWLAGNNLATDLRMAPHPWLEGMPWSERPMLSVSKGVSRTTDLTSVTTPFAAIAETGTLMLVSGPETPTTLNFTPDNCIVVMKASQIVGAMEEAWDRLRAARGEAVMPRTVNFVSGPSRTADIAQEIIMGAHGPRKLHVVIVEDGQAA